MDERLRPWLQLRRQMLNGQIQELGYSMTNREAAELIFVSAPRERCKWLEMQDIKPSPTYADRLTDADRDWLRTMRIDPER